MYSDIKNYLFQAELQSTTFSKSATTQEGPGCKSLYSMEYFLFIEACGHTIKSNQFVAALQVAVYQVSYNRPYVNT